MFSSKIPEKGQIMLVNHSETYLPRIYEADKRFVYSLAISWHLIFFCYSPSLHTYVIAKHLFPTQYKRYYLLVVYVSHPQSMVLYMYDD